MGAPDLPQPSNALNPPWPTVVLRHVLPDGTFHFDWMLVQSAGGNQPLVTFRAAMRPDDLAADQWLDLERLPDHRPEYLEFEGEIQGNRGSVHRLANGEIVSWRTGEDSDGLHWQMQIRWLTANQVAITQHLRVFLQNSPHCPLFCVSIEKS